MEKTNKPTFAPQLFIKNGVTNIEFYTKAFGAVELYRFTNEDNSIHVAELSMNGTIFHLHEETPNPNTFNPEKNTGTTIKIGLFVEDVDVVMKSASTAGGEVISPAQDYEYGYRQGEIKDPFGHLWMIEKKI